MKITNVEIAKMVFKRGYDYRKALDSIDVSRTPEQEESDITEKEVDDIVKKICDSFDEEEEMNKYDPIKQSIIKQMENSWSDLINMELSSALEMGD